MKKHSEQNAELPGKRCKAIGSREDYRKIGERCPSYWGGESMAAAAT